MSSAMKKLAPKKLALSTRSLRVLVDRELAGVVGGWTLRPPITWSCPQPSQSQCCPQTE